jgi:hypothetical protein
VSSAPRIDPRGTSPDTEPVAGDALWYAVALGCTLVVPFALAVGLLVVERVPGQSVLLFVGLGVGTTAVSAALAITRPRPSLKAVLARVVVVVLLAVAVRFALPSPAANLAAIRAGEELVITGVVGAAGAVVAFAMAVGHLLTSDLLTFVRERDSRAHLVDQQRRVLLGWFGALLGVALVNLFTGALAFPLVAVATLVAAGAGLLLLVDLGARAEPIGSLRPPLAAVPRGPARRGGAALLAAVGLLLLVVAPILPTVPLALSDRLAELLDPDIPRGQRTGTPPDFAGSEIPEEPPLWLDLRQRAEEVLVAIPDWVGWVVLALLLALVLAAIRPQRWFGSIGAVLAALLRGRWSALRRGKDTEAEAASAVDAVVAPRAARAGAFDRFRPRPRDPRRAIVHDYLKAERLFARVELARTTGETPLEHGDRVAGLRSLPAAQELASLASTARYAAPDPDPAVAERSLELVRELERAVKDAAGTAR